MNLPPTADPRSPQLAADILKNCRTIAVVGFSTNPEKPAHFAPMELVRRGYDVIPVNPNVSEIAGIKTYPSLAAIDRPVDIVDVFRPAADAPDIAREAAAIGAKTLWLQQGITSDEAKSIAKAANMSYIEDQCVKQIAQGFNLIAPKKENSTAPAELRS